MFGVGTFASTSGETFPGLVVTERVLDLRPLFGARTTTGEMLMHWDATLERLHTVAHGDLDGSYRLRDLRPLPPVQPIGQLFCAGANYRQHVAEIAASMGLNDGAGDHGRPTVADVGIELAQVHSGLKTPFLFAMPASAMSGARDDIVLWGPGIQHDWELELAIVIGKHARHVSREQATDCIAGYAMSNDISTRDMMFRPNLPMTDFLMTKGRPGFFPTGPYFVPREFVGDYRQLRLTLKVNDEVMQDEFAGAMIHGVEELVSYASTVTDLKPGDILLTGSPAGNAGHHAHRWLRPGDVVSAGIGGLGEMRNLCVSEPIRANTDFAGTAASLP